MRVWLTLTAALLIPSVAGAAEYGKMNRLQSQIEKLNARIEKLEEDLVKARSTAPVNVQNRVATSVSNDLIDQLEQDLVKARNLAQLSANRRPATRTAATHSPRVGASHAKATAAKAEVHALLKPAIIDVMLPEITISALPPLVAQPAQIVEVQFPAGKPLEGTKTADAAEAVSSDDDFDYEASEEPLIRLNPETGKPMRSSPAPKSEPAPKSDCTDKAKCPTAPADKQAMVLPTPTTGVRHTRLSWR
jgi:hypothetical protein